MSPSSVIRVAIVEDDSVHLQSFCQAVEESADMRLVGAFNNGRSALEWLAHNMPDVLLTDLGLPDLPGLAVLTYCAQRHPGCDIMVITLYDDPAHVVSCLEAGATGYLLKDSMKTEVAQHIRDIRAGGSPLSPSIARQVLRRFRPHPSTKCGEPAVPAVVDLTDRELVVLTRLTQGFRYAEIAELECISIHTVQAHVKHIYTKLAVRSRSEATHEALQLGLIKRQP